MGFEEVSIGLVDDSSLLDCSVRRRPRKAQFGRCHEATVAMLGH